MKPMQWVKAVLCVVLGGLSTYLFVLSIGVDYQILVAEQHVRFRQEMPTMDSWINSPFGVLKSYVFNVTNAAEFASGRDKRLKIQEIGPITYKVVGYNDILERNETHVTYSKHRYRVVEFLPEESVAPDVLSWNITAVNSVLLGAAAKLRPMMLFGYDVILMNEKEFLTNSIYWFLWELTDDFLKSISKVSTLSANVAVLHNVSGLPNPRHSNLSRFPPPGSHGQGGGLHGEDWAGTGARELLPRRSPQRQPDHPGAK